MLTTAENKMHAAAKELPGERAPSRMQQVDAIILGGGQGTRLYPLTLTRSKPSVSFGGYYRIIDVAISNAINSGCRKVSIITQFFSTDLHKHIYRTYRDSFFANGYLELLTAEERPARRGWFSGTADAVRQNLNYLIESSADYFLILAGDQLYNIDFQEMLNFATAADADLTIACTPMDENSAKRMGIMCIDEDFKITNFVEKSQDPEVLQSFKMPDKIIKKLTSTPKPFLASMGIYLFKRQALVDLLNNDEREDFGKHLIPKQVSQGKTVAFLHEGYWEDIGTIDSFHKANIALTEPCPVFDCHDETWPLYCRQQNLPGPKVMNTTMNRAIMCQGCIVEADEITRSILGPRTVVGKGCIIRDTYVMGNDFYTPPKYSKLPKTLSIGENTLIFNAIIDKHVSIGNNVHLVNKQNLVTYDSPSVYIRDGVIIVPKGAAIPDGFSI
jgi:glucose-1-phosphate adenylyltransferase